jgi:hypothetical protein
MTTSAPETNGNGQKNGSGSSTAMVPTAGAAEADGAINAFSSQSNFEAAQRMAKALSSSSLVPQAYAGNIPNTLIAMELAARVGASVFAVMQNLDVIHGRPSWRAQFLIATVNGCGRFSPIRYKWSGKDGSDDWGCRAYAKDIKSGDDEPCIGPKVTIAMAKAEGWYGKNGSKWKTLPELMLMYRAGAFFARVYAPELSLGMHTTEEVIDTTGIVVSETVAASTPGDLKALEAELLSAPKLAVQEEPHDPVTGEILEQAGLPGVG